MTAPIRTRCRPDIARLACLFFLFVCPTLPAQQVSPDDAALLVLNAGRRAYNEKKFSFAADRFREFLRTTPNHKEAPSARYALGLALRETGDMKGALEALQPASAQEFPDRPLALYHLGILQRSAGTDTLAQIAAKPNEAEQLRKAAAPRFVEALASFAGAADQLAQRLKRLAAEGGAASTDGEWLMRARCDQVEMQLRLGQYKEAAEIAGGLADDAPGKEDPSRPLALYHLGYAKFSLKEYLAAGQALSQLAPFKQEFGVHAHYLLGRTHHLSGEGTEAAAQYQAVLSGHEEQKKSAQESLKNASILSSEQKGALEALVNQPPPEHVARAAFYTAVLRLEEGKENDAAEQFATFAQKHPKSPLLAEAQLRQGVALVQLKKFPEALKSLDPLKDHPQVGDQAMLWVARARLGAADPAKTAEFEQVVNGALDLLRRAADRCRELATTDAEAKTRRPEILMELADTAVLAKQFKEATTHYDAVIAEKPERAEEAMERQVAALHLAAQYPESDALAAKFETTYPKSTLLPAVLFRSAENAHLGALKISGAEEQKKALAEAVKRYERVIEKFPESAPVNMARHGLATTHYRLGDYARAAKLFATIAEPDRTGDLANVPYLLADCIIRTFPPEADDALTAARTIAQAEEAVKLLESFTSGQEKSPQAGDALLKLGHCYQSVANLMAAPAERTKLLTSARDTYDRALKLPPKEPVTSTATFERAKCIALLGDGNQAAGILGQFQNPPLNATPNAPLALLRLSTLLRAQGKAAEAVNVMMQCKAQHEAKLQGDLARKDWVPMIPYEHALAVKETGKLAEARALFEAMASQFAGRPEALNATWRASQCRREEAAAQLAAARTGATKPEMSADEAKALEAATKALTAAAEAFRGQAAEITKTAPASAARLHLLYEVAWCDRLLGERELDQVQQKRRSGDPSSAATASVPMQPAEQRAIKSYQEIIDAAPDSRLATQVRCELAEMLDARGETVGAVDLLTDALEHDPPAELAEKVRLGLAGAHLARGDAKLAMSYVQPLLVSVAPTGTPAPPTAAQGEARLVAGEAFIQQEDWQKAIQQLLPFRDDDKLRNFPGISDRALLRLGHAYSQAFQWDQGRQVLETLTQRYGQSPWIDDARYGIGWARQKQKDFDGAVGAYTEVTKRHTAELGGKAQLQIGLCRLEQKRYDEAVKALQAVIFTYPFPDLVAPARCELARAQLGLKKMEEARQGWEQVMNDYPQSPWADVARKHLSEIKQ